MKNFKNLKIWQKGMELETELLVIEMVGFGDKTLVQVLLKDVDEEQKMLNSFIQTVGSA